MMNALDKQIYIVIIYISSPLVFVHIWSSLNSTRWSRVLVSGVLSFMVVQTHYDESLGRHVKIWHCKLCGYKSKHKHVCREHMHWKHAKPEHLPCEYCGKVLTNQPSLRLHKMKCMKSQLYPAH